MNRINPKFTITDHIKIDDVVKAQYIVFADLVGML